MGPNLAILKSPMNWLLAAFSVALLMFVFHFIFKGTTDNG